MDITDLIPRQQAIELVATTLKQSIRHVSDRVLKRTDFPKPRKKVGRAELYGRPDIERFLSGGK